MDLLQRDKQGRSSISNTTLIMSERSSGVKLVGPKLVGPDDIANRREQVLARYQEFKDAAQKRRLKLEEARQMQQFRRDADELEAWIDEKIQIASDEAYKDRRNLQVLTNNAISSFTVSHPACY